jgi:hypothetical protein
VKVAHHNVTHFDQHQVKKNMGNMYHTPNILLGLDIRVNLNAILILAGRGAVMKKQ